MIKLLHECHPGICRMKRLARGYVWWPGMDDELEQVVKQCTQCQENQKLPPKVLMHPWEWPDRPWSRIHVDYEGPIQGKMVLVVVDARSKWLEALRVAAAISQSTIEKLRFIFSTHGLPEVLVSDNGTSFTSAEFAAFTKANGIRRLRIVPYHPASNGLAERVLYYTIYGMLSTPFTRAYENVFWLDDRGDKGPCRRVGAKLMSRANSMEWRGSATSTREPSFLGNSQCSVCST